MTTNDNLFDGVVIFCAVVEHSSFSAAAIATDHSTSYISKTVSKLEARLNSRLLNRTTRSITLTADGELYYQHCTKLIQDAQQAEAFTQTMEPSGTLRISAPLIYTLKVLRALFNQYLVRYPKVKLDLDLSDRKVDLVSEGFDLAIRITPKMEDSSLIARRVATSNIVTVASPRYLEQYEKITHPQQLSKHNCICYTYTANKNNWRFSIENHIYNVEVGSNFTTNNGEIQLGFALDHLGITRVPEFFVSEHIENGNLQKILTQYDNESVDIYVVYASRKHQSARVRSFIEFITQTLH